MKHPKCSVSCKLTWKTVSHIYLRVVLFTFVPVIAIRFYIWFFINDSQLIPHSLLGFSDFFEIHVFLLEKSL